MGGGGNYKDFYLVFFILKVFILLFKKLIGVILIVKYFNFKFYIWGLGK